MHRFFEWNKNKNAKKFHLCQKAEIKKNLRNEKKTEYLNKVHNGEEWRPKFYD